MRRAAAAGLLALLAVACTGEEPPAREVDGGKRVGVERRACDRLGELVERVRRGHYPVRSPDIAVIPRTPNFLGSALARPHAGPWDFLMNVPLLLYGPGMIESAGMVSRPATMADLAPTTAELIGFGDWPRRRGNVLDEALIEGARPPRLIVTVVWDGGGDNALEAHPDTWPNLRRLMKKGTAYENMTVGSSPTNTPPVHATLGTGVYPERHGVVSVTQRDENGRYIDPWLGTPEVLETSTLADVYDQTTGNRSLAGVVATVNWHLGMMGHGSGIAGGDKDISVLLDIQGLPYGYEDFYSLPAIGDTARLEELSRQLDLADGRNDRQWLGNPLTDPELRSKSPAFVRYQEEVLEDTITEQGFGDDDVPDLLYVNIKPTDLVGHEWGIDSKEMASVISAQDDALGRLVRFLDDEVGRGRWALLLTADHGIMSPSQSARGWATDHTQLKKDFNAQFDEIDNSTGIVDKVTTFGAYIRRDELRRNGLTLRSAARWMVRYTIAMNLKPGERLPSRFEGRENELLFEAAVVNGRQTVSNCR